MKFNRIEDVYSFLNSHSDISKGLEETINIEHKVAKEVGYKGKQYEMTFSWASYSLSPFPGNCGIVVSHNAWIDTDQRGYGLGQYFHEERLKFIKDLGYSCGICTVISTNTAEKNLLLKNNWKRVYSFLNKRTSNTCEIWVKDIE